MLATVIDRIRHEPVVVVNTVLGVLVYFGVEFSDADVATFTQVFAAVAPVLAGLVARSQVTPERSARVREEWAAIEAYRHVNA